MTDQNTIPARATTTNTPADPTTGQKASARSFLDVPLARRAARPISTIAITINPRPTSSAVVDGPIDSRSGRTN